MIPYKAQASNPSRSGDTALPCPTYCLTLCVQFESKIDTKLPGDGTASK